jgi:iron complex outermembrane receptor protein
MNRTRVGKERAGFRCSAITWLLLVLVFFPAVASAGDRIRDTKINFDIPRQRTDHALIEFAQQANVTFIFPVELAEQTFSNRLAGMYSLKEALQLLLDGTQLKPEFTLDGVKVIGRTHETHASEEESTMLNPQNKAGLFRRIALALAAGFAVSTHAQAQDGSTQTDKPGIEEVVVTAQKRETSLGDTAISISVLSGSELEKRSLVSATDYLSTVPSVHIDSFGLGTNQLVIRGLGLSIGQSPTAAAYFGEVPLSDALDFSIIDMKLIDMSRVEVLRGPQGTLYGSGAMGGIVRQIPNAPVLNDHWGQIKLGLADTAESDDISYNGVASFNLPLVEDKVALRFSAYHYQKAGYVDLVSTPYMESLSDYLQLPVVVEEDTGGHTYSGARASALFTPSDALDLTLTLGYQKLEEDGRSELSMSSGEYVFSVLDTGEEFREQEFSFASLVVNLDLDWATLSSSTNLTDTSNSQNFSHSRLLPSGSTVPSDSDKDGFFQEFRLATQFEGPLQFQGGAYYEDIEKDDVVAIDWVSPNMQALLDFWGTLDPDILDSYTHADLKQLAFFGEGSYELTEKLKFTAGARWFDYERHDSSVSLIGLEPGTPPFVIATGDLPTEEDGAVYKAGLDFKPTDNSLLYATWSEGFRLGQTIDNSATYAVFGEVCDQNGDGFIDGTQYPYRAKETLLSDSITNYELGGKFALFDSRLSINAAVYRIDWTDVPVSVSVAVDGLGCAATFNGGRARSQGVELDTVYQATENLQLSFSGSLTDAEYRDDIAGNQGERLPFSPEYNANFGIQYSFKTLGRESYIRSDLSFVGDSATSQNAPDVEYTDAYHTLGMRWGVAFERVNLELYGTNLTNEDALVGVFNLDRGWRMEPRIIGIDAIFDF